MGIVNDYAGNQLDLPHRVVKAENNQWGTFVLEALNPKTNQWEGVRPPRRDTLDQREQEFLRWYDQALLSAGQEVYEKPSNQTVLRKPQFNPLTGHWD